MRHQRKARQPQMPLGFKKRQVFFPQFVKPGPFHFSHPHILLTCENSQGHKKRILSSPNMGRKNPRYHPNYAFWRRFHPLTREGRRRFHGGAPGRRCCFTRQKPCSGWFSLCGQSKTKLPHLSFFQYDCWAKITNKFRRQQARQASLAGCPPSYIKAKATVTAARRYGKAHRQQKLLQRPPPNYGKGAPQQRWHLPLLYAGFFPLSITASPIPRPFLHKSGSQSFGR